MKSDERRQKLEAAGIPDSKPFVAPEDGKPRTTRIESCHINGVLVSDLHLGPEVLAALDYWASDEGIAERAANPNARAASGITLGAGPFEKALEQKKDDVIDRGMESWEARDPFKETADKYAKAGMRPKMMSAQKLRDGGNTDYVVVKDENGDPVKVKGMILGHIPEERAQARNRHYQRRGNQLLKEITERYKAEGGATAVSDQ